MRLRGTEGIEGQRDRGVRGNRGNRGNSGGSRGDRIVGRDVISVSSFNLELGIQVLRF